MFAKTLSFRIGKSVGKANAIVLQKALQKFPQYGFEDGSARLDKTRSIFSCLAYVNNVILDVKTWHALECCRNVFAGDIFPALQIKIQYYV